MAKLSAINKNNKRIKLSDRFYKKRLSLKKDWIINGMRYRPSELKVLLRRLLIWEKSWEVIHSGSNYSVFPNIHPFLKKVDLSLPDFIRSFYGHNYGYVLKKSHE